MLPEGRFDLVAPPDAPIGVVVLHPHPDYGGDRHNAVVDAVYRAAVARGWAAVRPDLASGDPSEAVADARAALELLPADLPLAVVGYSFGAAVAARMTDERIERWVLVAPPFGALLDGSDAAIGPDPRPKLLLVPAHDQFSPPPRAEASVAGWAEAEVEVIAGADHFLAGATGAVAQRACGWLAGSA